MKNYDKAKVPAPWGKHGATLTIGEVKAERLRVKNARREVNGLQPLKSYAQL